MSGFKGLENPQFLTSFLSYYPFLPLTITIFLKCWVGPHQQYWEAILASMLRLYTLYLALLNYMPCWGWFVWKTCALTPVWLLQFVKDYMLKLQRMCNQNKFTVINSKVGSGLQFEVWKKDYWLMLKIYKQVPMSVKGRSSRKWMLESLTLQRVSIAFLTSSFLSLSAAFLVTRVWNLLFSECIRWKVEKKWHIDKWLGE